MKFLKHIFIISFFVFSISSQAQITGSGNFVQLPYEYHFCLDNSDMCLPLPANWGFQVPHLKDNNATLTITSNTATYYVSFDKIRTASIMFAMPDQKKPCLELVISSFSETEDAVEAIKSDFGTFQKVEQLNDSKIESYQTISSSNMLTFNILATDEKEKQTCRDLIASVKSKYSYGIGETTYIENQSITYNANDTTYYPEMGLKFVIPFDASAYIKAPKYVIDDATTLLTAYVTPEQLRNDGGDAGEFEAPNFSMTYNFYPVIENGEENTMDAMVQSMSYSYNESCVRTFPYTINKTNSIVCVMGSASIPTVCAIIPTKNYYAIFKFKNVTNTSIDNVISFISKINIADSLKPQHQKAIISLKSLKESIDIKEFAFSEPLKEITLEKKQPKGTKLIKVIFSDLNAEMYIPNFGGLEAYSNGERVDEFENKETVTLKCGEEAEYGIYAGVATHSNSTGVCVLTIPENPNKYTAEQYLYSLYAEYDCGRESEVKRVGTTTIKSKKWYIFENEEASIYVTEQKDKLIEVRVGKYNYESETNFSTAVEPLLYKASFK